MIWNNVELVNVARVQKRYDGAAKLLRFPENVHRAFGTADNKFPFVPAEFSTGCEIIGRAVIPSEYKNCFWLIQK